MLKDAKETSRAIDLMFESCENIRNKDGCAECPLRSACLNDPEVHFMDIFESSYPNLWDEFYTYADNVEYPKEELDAQHADFARKLDIEERMLDE